MEYQEDFKRKFPYRYQITIWYKPEEFKVLFDHIKEYIQNFRFHKKSRMRGIVSITFYFKRMEDSFLFKLNFADHENFKLNEYKDNAFYTPYIPLTITGTVATRTLSKINISPILTASGMIKKNP